MKKRLLAATLMFLIVAAAVMGIAVYHYSSRNRIKHPLPPSPAPAKPSSIAVNGTVFTAGFGTNPENITFENLKTGQNCTADVTGQIYTSDGAAIGRYAIALPNQETYEVIIEYSTVHGIPSQGPVGVGYLTFNSTVADEDFSFNTSCSSLTQNFSC